MAIKIGSISISLTAETSSFQQDMGKASAIALNSSKNIERSFTIMGAAITAATGSAVGALGLLVDKTQDAVFNMQKMAQQAGVSMEQFSKMAYAAKVAGLPMDQMANIMTRVAHSQMLASYGSLEQAAAYKALGVSVTDANGRFKTTDQLMLELAKKLDQYKDSANKTGVETIIMGRSGAQAAEFMKVLATRFDETSATAQKLGVIFTEQTAEGAQKLHDAMVEIEEAGMGLSVRLLSQVSPALDDVAQKIVALMSDAKAMHEIDEVGHDIAEGIKLGAEAVELLVKHATAMKVILGSLAGIRLAGFFGPMIASASETSGLMGKLGMASLNLTGNLLGVKKLGNVLSPLAKSAAEAAVAAKDYTVAIAALASEEGIAAAGSLAMTDALNAASAAFARLNKVLVPLLIVYEAYSEATQAFHNAETLHSETGASMWQNIKANIDYATTSLEGFKNTLEAMFGVQSAINAEHLGIKDIINGPDPAFIHRTPAAPSAYGLKVPGAWDGKTYTDTKKKDVPGLPDPEIEALKKKVDELIEKAHAAQRAFALVGASPQQQRNAEILDKYNQFLIANKVALEKMSRAQRVALEVEAHAAIVTQVNTDAATKYATELLNLHDGLAQSTADHLAMAAAVGKSAQAMQDAIVAAKVAAEMQRMFGANWRMNPDALAAVDSLSKSTRDELNTGNQLADNQSLLNTQQQLDAQIRLNNAYSAGAEARRQARMESAQAAVRADFAARGDTDTEALQKQLDLVRKMSDAEDAASDIERASSMSAVARYKEQVQSIQDAIEAAHLYGVALDYRAVLAANKEAWMQFEDAQDRAILATGDMLDGFRVALDQLARDTESDAQMMHDALLHAIESINSSLSQSLMAHAYTGHEYRQNILNGLSGTVRGIGSSVLNNALKRGESALLKGAGLGKPDGTSHNPWYVRLVGEKPLAGANPLNHAPTIDMAGWTKSLSSGGGFMSSLFKSILGFLPKFADGGDVIPGMPSIIGERGPELFVPPSAGHIVSNGALRDGFGGGVHHWHIDATGAHDPAQTVALIHRYMQHAAPQIAAAGAKAVYEGHARRPSTVRS